MTSNCQGAGNKPNKTACRPLANIPGSMFTSAQVQKGSVRVWCNLNMNSPLHFQIGDKPEILLSLSNEALKLSA